MIGDSERIFVLPDLGEGLQDAEIVAWHVAAGDHVVADQPLVSVETDKAVVEIPSPHRGRIERLLAEMHARLPIGAPLVAFAAGAATDSGTVVGSLTVPVTALAASLAVDLAGVTGSGPQGEITRADVERAKAAEGGMEPFRGVRPAMAKRMAQAGREVVSATVTEEADVGDWPAGMPVAARLVVALARRLHPDIHVGIAVDTEDGLIVPVLRDAGSLAVPAIAAEVERLKTEARARRIAPDALRGATITLSDFGAMRYRR